MITLSLDAATKTGKRNKGQRRREENEMWWSRPASDTPTGTSVGVFCGETGHALDRKIHVRFFLDLLFSKNSLCLSRKNARSKFFWNFFSPIKQKPLIFRVFLLRPSRQKFFWSDFPEKEKKRTKRKERSLYFRKTRKRSGVRERDWGMPSSARAMPSARSQISWVSEGERCLPLILSKLILSILIYSLYTKWIQR